jgi:hypothetical protein
VSDLAIRVTIFLNHVANAVGQILLWPLGLLPDLVGAIMVAVVTGILMLIGFKYSSPQSLIKKIRNNIKAELLALSLFKDSVVVNLVSQAKILLGALQSVLVSLIPIAFMMIPVTLVLGQLSLWWQVRPLHVNEEAVVTVTLTGTEKSEWPDVTLQPSSAFESTIGPVRIRGQRAVCWNVQAKEPGYHRLIFRVDGRDIEKQLAVGPHTMRVSSQRPGWKWTNVVLHPAEAPFLPESPVKSIEIQYPKSIEWATGSNSWLIFWFIASTVVAFCFRGVFNVNL